MIKIIFMISLVFGLTSCLKTRSELGSQYQSQVYTQKQADNQTLPNSGPEPKIDERDELIRQLNGRVESLEKQLSEVQMSKNSSAEAEKMQLLQDSLVKMEMQLQKLENEAALKPSDSRVRMPAPAKQTEVKNTETKKDEPKTEKVAAVKESIDKKTTFDVAQELYASKDFKKAILEYEKFVSANPKNKNVPEAKYKIGACFEAMGMKDEAFSFYEEVASLYSGSTYGKKAKQKVSKK